MVDQVHIVLYYRANPSSRRQTLLQAQDQTVTEDYHNQTLTPHQQTRLPIHNHHPQRKAIGSK